jgi:sodium/bile acid cotransporter 7
VKNAGDGLGKVVCGTLLVLAVVRLAAAQAPELQRGGRTASPSCSPGRAGMLILPVMLFHQIRLRVCAVLAQRYAQRPEAVA